MGKITAIINTYNEEKNIREAIEAVRGFDEILVCDMESTDNTRSIAESMGSRVIIFEKKDYNIVEPARQFAIDAAMNEWVLVLDADELVTPELKAYLYGYIDNANAAEGLLIARKNHTLNHFVKSSYPDYQLRFFKKDKVQWPPLIHSRPIIDGRVDKIPSKDIRLALVHKSESMEKIIEKANVYTSNELKRKKAGGVSLWKLISKPTFTFFKFYILKGGIRYGKIGFIQSANKAIYKYYLLCKLLERSQSN